MPIFEFQCPCGIKFEAPGKMIAALKPRPCPECGQDAERLVPSSIGGVFLQDVTGPVPQNTGVASLDAHIDRVIGKSAEKGWKVHSNRVDEKKAVLAENPGATGYDLTETPDGGFEIMPENKRGFQDRALAINSLAISSLKQVEPQDGK